MSSPSSPLSPRLSKVLEDLAERIIPSGGPDYPGARDVGLPDKMLDMVAGFPGAMPGFKLILWMWELSPFFYTLKFRPFSRLSPEAQNEFLEGYEKSWFYFRRITLTLLKILFMARFYTDPHIQEKMGYTEGCLAPLEKVMPPWSPEEGKP